MLLMAHGLRPIHSPPTSPEGRKVKKAGNATGRDTGSATGADGVKLQAKKKKARKSKKARKAARAASDQAEDDMRSKETAGGSGLEQAVGGTGLPETTCGDEVLRARSSHALCIHFR